jgi:two-component system, NarL family, response regulator NreC
LAFVGDGVRMTPTAVLLVDDHPLFRQGLRTLLESESDLVVSGEASSARQAYELADARHPDLIVLDVSLPGVDGVAAARELKRRLPETRILILSMYRERHMVAQALASGANGYALKRQTPEQVLGAIRSVVRGDRYLAPELGPVEESADQSGPLDALSTREREVFELLVRGFSNPRAAKELCISVKTVETHRTHIHHKLGVHSVAELMRFAAMNDLLRV